MDLERLKRLIGENTLWINTAGTGIFLADELEAKGIKVNRFTRLDQTTIQEYLNSKPKAAK